MTRSVGAGAITSGQTQQESFGVSGKSKTPKKRQKDSRFRKTRI